MNRDVLAVIFHGTWKIVLKEEEFGPFATEEEAAQTARSWAENAKKQGHSVSVVIRGEYADHGVSSR